jgi:hypothetical protein
VSERRSTIQGDPGGKVNILGGVSIGHCEENVHVNMCLILKGYGDSSLIPQIQKHSEW